MTTESPRLERFDTHELATLELFEYLIGNTDWSVVGSHNILLLAGPDGEAPFLGFVLIPNGEREVQYVQRSDQVPAGGAVLTHAEIERLVVALERIQERFKRLYDAQQDPKFAMDVEWKFDANGRLVVKQARPVVE